MTSQKTWRTTPVARNLLIVLLFRVQQHTTLQNVLVIQTLNYWFRVLKLSNFLICCCSGPPPDWTGPDPPRGSEVFVAKLPRDCYEDELVPVIRGHS